jgi:hypothetical protein
MDYRWCLNTKRFICILILLFVNKVGANCQTVSSHLEIEVVQTEAFGKVLSLRTIVDNKSGENLFFDWFSPAVSIEKWDTLTAKFLDYHEYWFAAIKFDPNREQLLRLLGFPTLEGEKRKDETFGRAFSKELLNYNSAIKDLKSLEFWVAAQIERIELVNQGGTVEFQTLINVLPRGSYRFGFHYSNSKEMVRIDPIDRFKDMRMPDKLGNFKRWRGEINSDLLYLNIK